MYKTLYAAVVATILLSSGAIMQAAGQTSKRDDKDYQKTAAELREDIWGMDLPHFKNYTVPEHYKSQSKVMLASYTDLSAGSNRRVRRGMTNITHISRQLVKLNDAVAVKEYSELSYTQLLKKRNYALNYKMSSFLGVRVIKPDGSMTEIKADEIVLTEDESSERKAKLAIPNLQPGDLLDYYVANEVKVDLAVVRSLPFYFELYDDVPSLRYGLHCTIGKKFAAEYRCYNGAPDFRSGEDEDGSITLDLNVDSLLLVRPGTFWVAPMRQFPMIQLNVVRGDAAPYTPFTRRRPGELLKNQLPEKIIKDEMIDLNGMKPYALAVVNGNMRKKSDVVEPYYDSLKKAGVNMFGVRGAAELYYMFRFDLMFGQARNPNALSLVNMLQDNLNTSMYSYLLCEYLRKHKLYTEVVLTTGNKGSRMSEVLNKGEIHYLCNLVEDGNMLFGATDYYSPAFYVPAALEGTKDAVAVNNSSLSGYMANNYTSHAIEIPVSKAEDNVHKETLSILPDAENNGVRVLRTTSFSGHYKEGTQKNLLLVEDFYNYEREYYNDKRSLAERVADKQNKKIAEELTAAFAAAREKQRDAFVTEAKEWLELEVMDMSDISIINPGIRHTSPVFEYGSTFKLDGVMKKAGNNQLLEVGKLIGAPSKVTDDQRTRTFDVYGPFARTTKVVLNIKVPEGFNIEGLEELNKSVRNNAGSFSVVATQEGSLVSISVESVFKTAHYTEKEWADLLSVMDARADWTASKLLLRKKAT
jgi:hypothetical protein